MSNLLVVFATTHGHSGRIAERIADVIRAHGHEVELAEVAVERFAHECAELPADRRAAI